MTANSYIRFEIEGEEMPFVKTEVWLVISNHHGNELGRIKWYSPWRRYAFFPAYGTIWDKSCLDAVNDKIETLHRIRKNVRVNQGKEKP